ncbi:MAG: peptidylprolyl isomerase [Magnetococcus sp. YQC-9]
MNVRAMHKKGWILALTGFWLMFTPVGLLAAPPAKEGAAVAEEKGAVLGRMGDVVVTVPEFQKLMNYSNKEVKKQLLANPEILKTKIREAVLRKAVLARAKAGKWDEKPEVAYLMQRAREEVLLEQYLQHAAKVSTDFPDESLIRKVYQENKENLQAPPSVNLAQIFLKIEPNADEKSRQEVVKNAEKLYASIKKGDGEFAALAKKNSQHQPSAEKGGDMGWVEVTQLLPEIRKAVEGMKPGEVKGPIASPQGVHIVKLISSRDAQARSLEEVREHLSQLLVNKKFVENKENIFKEMVEKYPISVNDESVLQLK